MELWNDGMLQHWIYKAEKDSFQTWLNSLLVEWLIR